MERRAPPPVEVPNRRCNLQKNCHPERSEAQPNAVEGPHLPKMYWRPQQEFLPDNDRATTSITYPCLCTLLCALCEFFVAPLAVKSFSLQSRLLSARVTIYFQK